MPAASETSVPIEDELARRLVDLHIEVMRGMTAPSPSKCGDMLLDLSKTLSRSKVTPEAYAIVLSIATIGRYLRNGEAPSADDWIEAVEHVAALSAGKQPTETTH